jgi:hypothetical protein
MAKMKVGLAASPSFRLDPVVPGHIRSLPVSKELVFGHLRPTIRGHEQVPATVSVGKNREVQPAAACCNQAIGPSLYTSAPFDLLLVSFEPPILCTEILCCISADKHHTRLTIQLKCSVFIQLAAHTIAGLSLSGTRRVTLMDIATRKKFWHVCNSPSPFSCTRLPRRYLSSWNQPQPRTVKSGCQACC